MICAAGGQFGNDAALTTSALVHVWDPPNPGVWTQLTSMPAPLSHISSSTFVLPANRMSAVAGVIGGDIYFTGGSNQVTTYKGVITG